MLAALDPWHAHLARLEGRNSGRLALAYKKLRFLRATRDDHAAYLATWLQVLKEDKRALLTAASHAQRAVDFLHVANPIATDAADTNTADDIAATKPLTAYAADACASGYIKA